MKIGLIGYGKMGKAIEEIALTRGHEIVFKITDENKNELVDLISKADVAIEFTSPESAIDNLKIAINANVPVICGSTGWAAQLPAMIDYAKQKNATFIYASNFSLGVNIFFKLNKILASIMHNFKEYSVEMEEIHHTQKKDAPSGTAITLAEDLISNYESLTEWCLTEEKKTEYSLPITAKRLENVTGTHIVEYKSAIDSISIKHEAFNRSGFALGALLAAEWLPGKKGFFTMSDVLNLK